MERGNKQILWTGSSVAQMGKEIVDALKCSGVWTQIERFDLAFQGVVSPDVTSLH